VGHGTARRGHAHDEERGDGGRADVLSERVDEDRDRHDGSAGAERAEEAADEEARCRGDEEWIQGLLLRPAHS
jgi:hypothetical protein